MLRSDHKNTVLPDEFIEYEHPTLTNFEGEVCIEPHTNSPSNWPQPALTRVIAGRIRIPNNTAEPVKLSKSQHFAMIRRVTSPAALSTLNSYVKQAKTPDVSIDNASLISIDPDGAIMTPEQKTACPAQRIYTDVFDPVTSPYNDRSGRIRANVIMGPVPPPPRKGKVPLYSQNELNDLQDQADKLEEVECCEARGHRCQGDACVSKFSRSETRWDKAICYPPSTNLVSTFAFLQRFRCPAMMFSGSLSSWKFIIKCDLKKAFYQLQVAKNIIPFLGTVTPFKGLYC